MSLALYPARVRSSDLLGHHLPTHHATRAPMRPVTVPTMAIPEAGNLYRPNIGAMATPRKNTPTAPLSAQAIVEAKTFRSGKLLVATETVQRRVASAATTFTAYSEDG